MSKRYMKSLALLFVICILCSTVICASTSRSITPRPVLSFSGTTAHCYTSIYASSSSTSISATLTLYYGNTEIDSWSDNGKGFLTISESCAVQRGRTYRLELTYSFNGIAQTPVSTTGTCPQ